MLMITILQVPVMHSWSQQMGAPEPAEFKDAASAHAMTATYMVMKQKSLFTSQESTGLQRAREASAGP